MSNASLSFSDVVNEQQQVQDYYLLQSVTRESQSRKALTVAVCWPCSTLSLAGAIEAADAGLIQPLLVGGEHELSELAKSAVSTSAPMK
jgi:phosphate acetyltransferase